MRPGSRTRARRESRAGRNRRPGSNQVQALALKPNCFGRVGNGSAHQIIDGLDDREQSYKRHDDGWGDG
jgi:hypothetical protein